MKRYRVVGSSTIGVNGLHSPGDEFSADMPVDTAAFLMKIGAIVEITDVAPISVAVEPDYGADAPHTPPEFDFGDDEKEDA